jgi:flavodoxin
VDPILVVFYSSTGTCRAAAELLCAQLGWPRGEILETHSRAGAAGTVRSILDTFLQRHPPITYDGPDPARYDAVVLVSPVWAGGLAGPMRSFVAQYGSSLKKFAVLTVMGHVGGSNAAAEIERRLGRSPLLTATFRTREVEDGSCALALQAFGQALRQSTTGAVATSDDKWSPRPA